MRKLTIDEIRRDAARHGGRCLTESYVDSLTLMEWECSQGHRWRAVAHAVHEIATLRGGKCLAKRYTNSQVKLEWECMHGHRWAASLNSVKQGSWCPQCRSHERARRQVSGRASAQSTAITQKPAAPSRPYSEPEANVASAVAPPIPTVP